MKASGIGGQAVMEGVMMKNKDKYAVAVRKPDNTIAIDIQDWKSLTVSNGFCKLPIIRGVVSFIESLVVGIKTLTYSASFFEEEETKPEKKVVDPKTKKRKEDAAMVGTVILSVALAIGIFMLLPYFISRFLSGVIESEAILALCEGILRVALFIGYVAAISLMKDIKRVFMYHGAEHKSINCIENGFELNVENVRRQSREHKRCGTSFLLFVMILSVICFMFIRVDNAWLRIVYRLLLVPVIAGVSYEFIRLAGRSENKVVAFLSKPGLALQTLTTREPDDSMIEVAIASVEAVFDWKAFLGMDKKDAKPEKKEAKPEKKDTKPEKKNKSYEAEPDEDDSRLGFMPQPEKATPEAEPAEKKIHREYIGVDLRKPIAPDEEEDDEVLRALDKFFTRTTDDKKE